MNTHHCCIIQQSLSTLQSYMFYEASNFKQNLNTWLKRVTEVSHTKWWSYAVCNGEKQFTSSSEVQGQVQIYCQDPENYDTTEYG